MTVKFMHFKCKNMLVTENLVCLHLLIFKRKPVCKVSFLAFVFAMLISFSGCVRYKSVVYMQDRYSKIDSLNSIPTSQETNVVLRSGDNIYVNVFGPNLADLGLFTKGSSTSNETNTYTEGYVIDLNGEINFPVTGKVKIAGLTIEMAQKMIQEKVNEYILNAVVDIRLMNYDITILGEVAKPGTYTFMEQNVNLLDVLGKAGDCNNYSDKRNIMVVRKEGDKTYTATINILSSDFIANPYFWLKPNDVIYIKPLRAKMMNINGPLINIILSSVSTITTILLYTTYLTR